MSNYVRWMPLMVLGLGVAFAGTAFFGCRWACGAFASAAAVGFGASIVAGLVLMIALWSMLRHLDRSLRSTEAQLETITTGLGLGLLITRIDEGFTVLYANDGVIRMLGYTREELQTEDGHNSALRVCMPEDHSPITNSVTKQLAAGNTVTFENRLVQRDGTVLRALVRGGRVHDPVQGEIGLWLVDDITDLKQTQQALEQQSRDLQLLMHQSEAYRESFRLIMDNALIPFWTLNATTHIMTYNVHIGHTFGWPLDTLSFSFEELLARIHPDDVPRVEQAVTDVFSGTSPRYEVEYRVRHGDGHWVWVLVRGEIMKNPATGESELAGIVVNNHASKLTMLYTMERAHELEHQVSIRTAELEARNRELEKSQREAMAATRAKSEFLATMSHEIRTPMNGILGLAYLALQGECSLSTRSYLTNIDTSARTLLRIINDILDFSKIESGKMELEHAPFKLDEIAQNTLHMFTHAVQAKGLALRLDMADNVPQRLMGDAMRVGQVLLNLVSNAVKFTDRGNVTISIRRHESDTPPADPHSVLLDVAVCDTGIGIEPENIERLFAPFTQADMSVSRRYGGTGLGLTISQHLVGLMGGVLTASSQPGKGTEFRFSIRLGLAPAEEAAQAADGAGRACGGMHERAHQSLKGLRVLLAEDNDINQLIAGEMLQSWGMDVDTASNGLEAVELAKTRPYSIILMDIQMPELDGLEATRRIRRTLPTVPIVAMTANAMMDDVEKSLAAGMQAHVSKPIDPALLRATIERWCGSHVLEAS